MGNEFFSKSLTLDVFIIGYKTQGESIVLIIKTDEIVSYTCVIDCYEENEINKTLQLLNSLKITHVDTICWTHPHIDHSLGIDVILDNYANKKTTVVIPEDLGSYRKNIDYSDRVRSTFETIENSCSIRSPSFYVMSASDVKPIVNITYIIGNKSYPFFINSVSPSSQLVRDRAQKTDPRKNDYSIAFSVKVGKFDLFFGSDIEDVTINQIKRRFREYIPSSFDLLKVPHHTSPSSRNFLSLLDTSKKCDIACSTVFRDSLPDLNLIKEYQLYTKKFLCTGYVESQYDTFDYGCIHVNYDILQEKRFIKKLHGNANDVYESFVEPLLNQQF